MKLRNKVPNGLRRWILAVLLLAALPAQPLFAQSWPARPIRLLIGFAPGSATDTVARTLAEPLGAALGQQIIVENRPGAASTVAAEATAHAQPDGYTLTLGTNSAMSTGPAGLVRVNYDPVRDFTALGRVGTVTFMLAGNNQLAARTLPELIENARKSPEKFNCASGNANGIVFCELFKQRVGAAMASVPYKSTPPAVTDLIGGQVQVMFIDVPTGAPRVRSGQIRAFAVTSPQRSSILADVPTFAEAGVANFPPNSGWWGLYGPAGLPRAVAERIAAALDAVLRQPDVRQRLLAAGVEPSHLPASEMDAFLSQQLEDWRRFLKEFNISPGL